MSSEVIHMTTFNVFDKTLEFAQRNHFIDIEDKLPIFVCSIGAHIFNAINKCSRCDFDPAHPQNNDFNKPITQQLLPTRIAQFPVSLDGANEIPFMASVGNSSQQLLGFIMWLHRVV